MQKIGIIGFGNMGQAIAQRIKDKFPVFVFEKDQSKLKEASEVTLTATIEGLAEQSDILILAIKPQDFEQVLTSIKDYVGSKLIVSIAAGITTAYIQKHLLKNPVIRVMPNLPATVGAGISCLAKGAYASTADLFFIQELFNKLGKTLVVDEKMMNAVTAISGSGPGFLYALISTKPKEEWEVFVTGEFKLKLAQAAEKIGFSSQQAMLLAAATAEGSLVLLKESRLSADLLRIKVTSKGGTTEAGLSVLHNSIANLEAAVKAALQRAEELANQ